MKMQSNWSLEIIENGGNAALEVVVTNTTEKFKLLSCKNIEISGLGFYVADANGDMYELEHLIIIHVNPTDTQYNSCQCSDLDGLVSEDNNEAIQPNAIVLLVDVNTNEPVKKEPIKGKVTNQLK